MARTKVLLKGQPNVDNQGAAGEVITPGMLVQGVSTVIKHAVANGPGRFYALEEDEMGKEVTGTYAIGDRVKVHSAKPGDRIYALIASGQNLSEGAYMGAAADGTLKAYASGSHSARALEAVDNSSGPGTSRIRVEVV